ncbi:MAG: hypothetical protein K2O45_11745, partial [Oscillospiraceae bacterium]|nr:hypothetical protein [Oscillospiraceae bacterium]
DDTRPHRVAAYHLIVHDPSMGSLHNRYGQAHARLCPIRGIKGSAVVVWLAKPLNDLFFFWWLGT